MKYIEITKENIGEQHICCAISATKAVQACANAKKSWMNEQFNNGYSFVKLNENGKVFIESTPGENAWCPISAKGWLFIDCFWVAGKFKSQGHASALLDTVLGRAAREGFYGLAALSSTKKMPFLSDPEFYRHKGFSTVDTTQPYYELLALPLVADAPPPRFKDCLFTQVPERGVSIWYTDHCPHNTKYLPLLRAVVLGNSVPFHEHKLLSPAEAQNAPNPFTTFAMYFNGRLVGNEIFSEAKMQKFLTEHADG